MFRTILYVLGYQAGVTGLSCGGDSGSPLVFFDSQKEHYVQVGVVSGGTCQSLSDPSIFARVEDHSTLEFIRKQFWNNIPSTSVKAIEKLRVENTKLTKENEMRKEEIAELKSKMTNENKKLSNDVQERKIENDQLKAKLKLLDTKYNELEKKITNNLKTNDYMFSAYTGPVTKYFTTYKYVTFDYFHVNQGNMFNLNTGTFTAPVKGIYEFSFSGNSDQDEMCSVHVYKNNEKIQAMFTSKPKFDFHAHIASSWFITLNVGDNVKLKVEYGEIAAWSNGYTTFNGKLLKML